MTAPGLARAGLIVALTGASGAIYGVRLLAALRAAEVTCHVVVSDAALITLKQELDLSRHDIAAMADVLYAPKDIGAAIASGSHKTLGMVIAPCSMNTLAAVATGASQNLIGRAADVCLKERRRLVLVPRETPLHLVHLRNMVTVTEMGGVIFPPVPAFYQHPSSISEMVEHSVGRILDLFDIPHALSPAWLGLSGAAAVARGASPASLD